MKQQTNVDEKDYIFFKIVRKIYRVVTETPMRLRLKNRNLTILAPTCIGGVIYHHLGLKFMSPTVNLWMTEDDFFLFVQNLDYFIQQEVLFYQQDEELDYPWGIINGEKKGEKIIVHFNHHKKFNDAVADWNRRKNRINLNNIFVIASTMGGENSEKIRRWETLIPKVKGLVVFTAKNYPQYSYCLQLSQFKDRECCPSYMVEGVSRVLKVHAWEKDFDYVNFLNTGKVK